MRLVNALLKKWTRLGWPAARLATATGISESTLKRYKQGDRPRLREPLRGKVESFIRDDWKPATTGSQATPDVAERALAYDAIAAVVDAIEQGDRSPLDRLLEWAERQRVRQQVRGTNPPP